MEVRPGARRARWLQLAPALLGAAIAGCHGRPRTGSAPARDSSSIQVGYGTQPRSQITGAVSSLDSTQIEGQQVTSVEELMIGRIPGVAVIHTANGLAVRIRGAGTLIGTGDPLFVVDGVPLPWGMPNVLAGINPRDVARIDVLKDGAAAIYGYRGANGVVLITTKRGP